MSASIWLIEKCRLSGCHVQVADLGPVLHSFTVAQLTTL